MRRRTFALAAVGMIVAGGSIGFGLRLLVDARAPEPEPRCVLDRMERRAGAPQLNLNGNPIMGGGLYEFWTCNGIEIRTYVGP